MYELIVQGRGRWFEPCMGLIMKRLSMRKATENYLIQNRLLHESQGAMYLVTAKLAIVYLSEMISHHKTIRKSVKIGTEDRAIITAEVKESKFDNCRKLIPLNLAWFFLHCMGNNRYRPAGLVLAVGRQGLHFYVYMTETFTASHTFLSP